MRRSDRRQAAQKSSFLLEMFKEATLRLKWVTKTEVSLLLEVGIYVCKLVFMHASWYLCMQVRIDVCKLVFMYASCYLCMQVGMYVCKLVFMHASWY